MPAITVTSGPYYNTNGRVQEWYYTATIVANGDTLLFPFNQVLTVDVSPDTHITGYTLTPNLSTASTTITFATDATQSTGVFITVRGT